VADFSSLLHTSASFINQFRAQIAGFSAATLNISVSLFDCRRQEMPVISLCLNGATETIEEEEEEELEANCDVSHL
jgi:hypothetical protein